MHHFPYDVYYIDVRRRLKYYEILRFSADYQRAVNSRAPTTRAMREYLCSIDGALKLFENRHSKRLINLGMEREESDVIRDLLQQYITTLAPQLCEKLYIHII
jgi:hypothetical protein